MPYQLDGEIYCLLDRNGRVLAKMPTVAIAFSLDEDGAVLMKHGTPSLVEQWVTKARASFAALPHNQNLGLSLYAIDGRFSVDDLNKVIECSGYINKFLKDIGFQPVSLNKPSSSVDTTLEP